MLLGSGDGHIVKVCKSSVFIGRLVLEDETRNCCAFRRNTPRDLGLPPRLNSVLSSSGLLRGVRWFETDVSGLRVFTIFKGQAAQEEGVLDNLTLEDGTGT
jgi:hypothetical protein